MLKLSLNNSHETVKGVRCNCFSKSDHQFRESPFSWKMAILALELEVYSFNVKHLFIPSSHASACLLGHPPEKWGILIFCISLEISKRGSFLGSCALSKFSHLTCVVDLHELLQLPVQSDHNGFQGPQYDLHLGSGGFSRWHQWWWWLSLTSSSSSTSAFSYHDWSCFMETTSYY